MKEKRCMLLPGPVYTPERIRNAMSKQMVERRGEDIKQLSKELIRDLKKVFKTERDVLFFVASGTGGMELALVNTLSPGDKVLALSCGNFGDRFADIAVAMGLNVVVERFPSGKPVDIDCVRKILQKDEEKDIKAVLITHNETSTGVVNDLEAISQLTREHGALSLVDAVSSLGCVDIRTDEWGLDVVVSASQKGLMSAPGIAMVSISPKAWEAVEKSRYPKYYWDIRRFKKFNEEKSLTPYTPAMTAMYGLKEALNMVLEEGYENVLERHRLITKALRAGLEAIGLELLVDEAYASPSVTAVKFPETIDSTAWRKALRNKYWVSTAGGLGDLIDTTFRIGHMGYIGREDIITGLSGIELSLREYGFPVEIGTGVAAAQKVFAE
ncbi:alanine--glyoxylate aminotransferase family protein [Alkaliphilus pronyensis]|uniref:Tritium exchange subunit n=1 Tax=Alkaliphilus pronyensis TaxID=1482732 RepID=A0A6I0F1S3_9FIRM|nr:alanine--glyoxylate aminotransferase family protein [Alkaliphilus pronyensis]KAB3535212.1 alanine--glyoxylate aminotransferase family protein [Alkaliphilus pronyensis]